MAFWDSLKGVVTDFSNQAATRVSTTLARYSTPKQSPGEVKTSGANLFDLMYAYGQGKKEKVKQKLTDKFLGSKTGKDLTASATQQRIQTVLMQPMTWLVVVLLVGGFIFIGRKT